MAFHEQLKLLYDQGLYSNVSALASMLLTVYENSSEIVTFPVKYQTFVYYGDSLFHSRDYKKAELMYRKALQLKKSISKNKGKAQPCTPVEITAEIDVKFQAHLCHVHLKQFPQAINILESISGKQRTPRINMAIAKLYHQNGMERAAVGAYKEVLKECPLAVEAAQGLLLLGTKCAEVASLMINSSVSGGNMDWLSMWIKVHSHLSARELSQAVASFKQLDMKTPLKDNVDVLVSLGEAYYFNGDFLNSVTVFERVHALDPLHLRGMDMYAALLAKEKKVKELETLASHMIAISDSSPEPWIAMAHFCFLTKKGTRAVNFAQKACMINPRYVEALLLKGTILLDLKKTHDALTHFGEANKIAPQRYESYKGLVDCYLTQHRIREAIAMASSACKQLGQTSRALTLYASVLAKDPLTAEKAKTLLEKALKQDPTHLNAVYQLASIYEQERMYEKGIELLKKQMEQQTTCRLHQMLGDFLARTNEHEKALHHFSIALNMDPSNHKVIESCQRVELNPESSESFDLDVEDTNDSENDGEMEQSEVEDVWSDVEYS